MAAAITAAVVSDGPVIPQLCIRGTGAAALSALVPEDRRSGLFMPAR